MHGAARVKNTVLTLLVTSEDVSMLPLEIIKDLINLIEISTHFLPLVSSFTP